MNEAKRMIEEFNRAEAKKAKDAMDRLDRNRGGNFTISYKFADLEGIAKYADRKATAHRSRIDPARPKTHRSVEHRASASAWESIADLLRSTEIVKEENKL